jgi:hypothetical protein
MWESFRSHFCLGFPVENLFLREVVVPAAREWRAHLTEMHLQSAVGRRYGGQRVDGQEEVEMLLHLQEAETMGRIFGQRPLGLGQTTERTPSFSPPFIRQPAF